MEVNLAPDIGHEDMLKIQHLSYEKWKIKVLSKIDEDLVNACLNFIERMRMDENVSKAKLHFLVF